MCWRSTVCIVAIACRNGCLDRVGQADPITDVGGPAADDVRRGQLAAEIGEACQHPNRGHAVRIEVAGAEVVLADLEHRDLAGRPLAGQRVDDHQSVVPVEQVVGQVHPADSVVDRPHLVGQGAGRGEAADDLGTEPVVAAE